jgi:predicted nuclease of predicted toxin-antitoxin system
MLILFDHVTPRGVARFLSGHTVITAKDRGWDTLSNGELLEAAERAGFDVVVTADKNMRYQQNLGGRKIAVVVLSTPQWPIVKLHLEKIAAAVNTATAGSYIEVELSVSPRPDIAR